MHSFTIGHAGAVGQAVERPGRAHRGWALVRRGNAAESTTGSIKDTRLHAIAKGRTFRPLGRIDLTALFLRQLSPAFQADGGR